MKVGQAIPMAEQSHVRDGRRLGLQPVPGERPVESDAPGDGVTFSTPPLPTETEVTGPIAAKLFVSSSTRDADLFLVVRVSEPAGREVVFPGALDPGPRSSSLLLPVIPATG